MKTTAKRKLLKTNTDLPDSKEDKKHLQQEETTLDLPDVKDIPGQEHVRPLPPGEMADTTVSSADEEAEALLDTDEDRPLELHNTNVTPEEKELLRQSAESTNGEDDVKLRQARVDSLDDDGEPLNEKANVSGSDLDIPGEELDDEGEEIGEEDEENNAYSHGGEKDDQNTGKQ